MIDRLFIAARAPRPGFTKTRLGCVIGHSAAASLYRAFLIDLSKRLSVVPFDVGWFITPPDAWSEIRDCLNRRDPMPVVVPQPDGDWAARQCGLFAGMDERGERRTVLIASDSPQLPVSHICDAFDLLETRDMVFGPVPDGGYYLIGMRDSAARAVLDGVPMSTADVLGRLLDRAAELEISTGLVESTFDVDEVEDLDRLSLAALSRSDLPATRIALQSLGLYQPRRAAPGLATTGIGVDR